MISLQVEQVYLWPRNILEGCFVPGQGRPAMDTEQCQSLGQLVWKVCLRNSLACWKVLAVSADYTNRRSQTECLWGQAVLRTSAFKVWCKAFVTNSRGCSDNGLKVSCTLFAASVYAEMADGLGLAGHVSFPEWTFPKERLVFVYVYSVADFGRHSSH